jgi:hypothetical protein
MIIGSLVPIAIMQSAHRERLRLRAS